MNLARPVASLTLAELTGLAQTITDQWIVVTSRRIATAPDSAEAIEGRYLLY